MNEKKEKEKTKKKIKRKKRVPKISIRIVLTFDIVIFIFSILYRLYVFPKHRRCYVVRSILDQVVDIPI